MTAAGGEPSAQGDLAKTPFAHLVLYIQKQRLSGTLIVDRTGFESKVLFRNGRAVAARPLPRGTMLQDGLLELCDLERAPYTFWDADLLEDATGVVKGTLDTFAFVADSLRGHVRDSVVAAIVDRYADVRLRLTADADLKRLGLRGQEGRMVERLRTTPMTPEEFASQSGLTSDDARHLIYLLVITGHAAVEQPSGRPTSGIRTATIQPPAGGRLSNWPVGSGAATEPPERTSRPVRHSNPPLASGRAESMKPGMGSETPHTSQRPVSLASMPAWQQLASMRPGPSQMPPPVQTVIPSAAPPPLETLDDAGKLRRAEQLAEHRNFDEAARIVERLMVRNPGSADYLAMRAWIQYQTYSGGDAPKSLLDLIERALRLDEQHARALYLKALMLKRLGREADALRYFQKVVDAEPSHLEAQRELRLAKMRR